MDALHTGDVPQRLGINTGLESPGSSVFDLPLQPSTRPGTTERKSPLTRRPHDSTGASAGTPDGAQSTTSFIVISGGTGGNAICSAFGSDACYVLPVSDDGGSSSEIIRVLGGPSIG